MGTHLRATEDQGYLLSTRPGPGSYHRLDLPREEVHTSYQENRGWALLTCASFLSPTTSWMQSWSLQICTGKHLWLILPWVVP